MGEKRKTVKADDRPENLEGEAIRELFAMIYFLDENPQWSIKDYMAQPGFPNSALGKLIQ